MKTFRIGFGWLVAALALSIAVAAQASVGGQHRLGQGKLPEPAVYAELQGSPNGTAYVIVMLQPLSAQDSDPSVTRLAVTETQQQALANLSADEFAPVYLYKNFAAMTGRVNAAGLAKLVHSSQVIAVGLDGIGHGHMTSSVPFINADDVHSLGYTGDGITVAVLDSGIDKNHADLSDNIAPGWYHFLDQGADYGPGAWHATKHGTNVAGIITSKGVYAGVGVAPDADILAIKVISSSDRFYFSDLAAGIDYVVDHQSDYQNLCVMNMSLGSFDLFSACPCDNADANTMLLQASIQSAKNSGIATFASSGNDCSCNSMSAPACVSSATAVAAVYDQDFGSHSCCGCTDSTTGPDKITCFSNRSACNELAAPGVKIWGPEPNDYNDYWFTGTSQAAPHCAGVAALMEEKAADLGITLSPDQIVQIMKNTGVATQDECETSPNPIRVDALAAVNAVASEPKPVVEHLKWSQPPIEIIPNSEIMSFCGWNQESWTKDPCSVFWQPTADDFRCFGSMPIATIHWWGSHLGWSRDFPPAQQPLSWLFRFWSNVPEPQDPQEDPNYSHPGQLVWQIQVPAERVHVEWVGYDQYWFLFESCFQYYVELEPDQYFRQADYNDLTEDSIYWLGIAAVYANDVNVPNPWGWKTRPISWMDDAVTHECRMVYDPELGWIFLCRLWPIKDPISGESVDVAFELGTDANYVKWEQRFTGVRQWPHYEDELSMGTDTAGPEPSVTLLAADDWQCSQRLPVTSMVWWGSYLDYSYEACQTFQAIPPDRPEYFWLTIWDDVPDPNPANPETFSHPNNIIWQYKAYDYDEVMVGYDKHPHDDSDPNEPVFWYSVRLSEPNWFYQQDVNGIYWLSIVAVFSEDNPRYDWGWTNHPYNFKGYAVKGSPNDVQGWDWQVLEDQTSSGEDMSFILSKEPGFCINCPDYDFSNLIDHSDLKLFTDDWLWSGPPGGYTYGDLDCDGNVEFEDYAIFALQWLRECP
jgi:subtilisin family serine protease